MELLFALMDSGWEEKCVQKSTRIPPFTAESDKHVFYHTSSETGGLHRFYLMALLKSEDIFSKGVTSIHYFQSEEYYKTLIQCSEEIAMILQPNRPAAEYKLLKDGGTTTHRQRGAVRMLLDDDDADGSVLAAILLPSDSVTGI